MTARGVIVLATRNPGKIREIRQVLAGLNVRIAGLEEYGDIPEPAEHGRTFAENARDKALYYARATGQWCLADDSGLAVDALGGAPGVRSARYAADDCPAGSPRKVIDRANNARLLRELSAVPDERRTARFICHLAMADGARVLIEASGSVEGVIGRQERGSNGFGYDPLFILPDRGLTTAELPADEKNLISHRGKALREFASLLKEYLVKGA
ncbi:MAG: RdgB/HAM1 family non-canonical purine NTP pyrophosphatase [Phycisphaerae bacterium]